MMMGATQYILGYIGTNDFGRILYIYKAPRQYSRFIIKVKPGSTARVDVETAAGAAADVIFTALVVS